eukprot:1374169-Prymnesium_polylepis.1
MDEAVVDGRMAREEDEAELAEAERVVDAAAARAEADDAARAAAVSAARGAANVIRPVASAAAALPNIARGTGKGKGAKRHRKVSPSEAPLIRVTGRDYLPRILLTSAKHLASQACDPSAGTARWRETDVWIDLRRGQRVSEGVPGKLSQLRAVPFNPRFECLPVALLLRRTF